MKATTGLIVEELTVRYGGNTAVDGVSFQALPGQITGLIGPNGAGKTSTFNACSGLLRPTAGTLHLDNVDITRLPPHRRSQLGLGRTFQRMELFETLSVRENIALGREASLAASRPLRHLWATHRATSELALATEDAIGLCGLSDLAESVVMSLSTGQRRLVELARAIATGCHVLLLDEPSSGLDQRETDRFGEILLWLVTSRHLGILLVEHDMRLVMGICDQIYVLDFGVLLFEGDPAAVQGSDVVRRAYLGATA